MDLNDIEVVEPLTPIQEFYCNSNVFITGGTGFLGRMLVEKLLRSCPDIDTIYLLVRKKCGREPKERIDVMLEDPIFTTVRSKGELKKKLVPLRGDCTLPHLGLKEADKQLLIEKANIVFHLAATVRLGEKLKNAANINVTGTYEVLKLCKAMTGLKSIVYVSTAYSHCHNTVISERFFPSPTEPKQLMNLAKNLNDSLMEELTPRLLQKYPNSYTFTKAVAEELLHEFGKHLPAAIIRPSLVVSSYKEPFGGYVNTFYGITSVISIVSCGLLKSLHCDGEKTANIVPADMCINAMIAIAVDAARSFKTRPSENNIEIPIYHFESSRDMPLTWKEYISKTMETIKKWPTMQTVWYNTFSLQKHYLIHMLLVIIYNFIPGLFSDFIMMIFGRTPWYMRTFKSTFRMTNELSYFTTKNFTFLSKRMHYLLDRMAAEDKKLFFCDLRQLQWNEFFETYFLGMRMYVLRDPIKTAKAARIRLDRY
ncbi:male sterility protein 2-related [Holotrichia oblita]|uniref:Male sterility protein 2-related n=1 Tax=Holotrichia oblita TaxID=644536 RepID=A0ACB9SIV4_HOLOL|nr:male sterility protein 2-related [Holotrichia oblita]